MVTTSLPALLLYGLSLVPVLVFQSPTIVVLTGENITLQCSNVSTVVGHVAWFKQVNRSEPVCLSAMYGSNSSTVQHTFGNRHYQMYSNNATIFLVLTYLEIADRDEAHNQAQLQQLNSQQNTDQDRDSLNYSALSFSQKRPRNNQSADEEQLSDTEAYVVYSVPR
ncbi:hypothetical protein DPEC_G00103940 [Dallia pectoralis]|uniref:Uncharacterized protein n=1 Tax=Dallia pectoralis TaxID=75939 RepID=A0ACC2GXW2_DALPE|nr:hypothetical protein DPEC_G00103940 [Dallia pectoralis]